MTMPLPLPNQTEPIIINNKGLYSPRIIAVITLLASVFAGSILMAYNYRALGRHQQAAKTVIIGTVVTLCLIGVGQFLPHGTGAGIAGASAFLMNRLANQFQGDQYKAHIANGGKNASKWLAVAISIGAVVIILGFIILFALFLH